MTTSHLRIVRRRCRSQLAYELCCRGGDSRLRRRPSEPSPASSWRASIGGSIHSRQARRADPVAAAARSRASNAAHPGLKAGPRPAGRAATSAPDGLADASDVVQHVGERAGLSDQNLVPAIAGRCAHRGERRPRSARAHTSHWACVMIKSGTSSASRSTSIAYSADWLDATASALARRSPGSSREESTRRTREPRLAGHFARIVAFVADAHHLVAQAEQIREFRWRWKSARQCAGRVPCRQLSGPSPRLLKQRWPVALPRLTLGMPERRQAAGTHLTDRPIPQPTFPKAWTS